MSKSNAAVALPEPEDDATDSDILVEMTAEPPNFSEGGWDREPRPAAVGATASGKNRDTENFPVGSIFIRPDLRPHIHVFYNFARAADDIADHPLLEPQEKLIRLSRFTAVMLSDRANDVPTAVAMRESLRQTGLGNQHCLDLITAFKRDATQLRYQDWDDLLDYCRYSASPVGRHVLALHGIGEHAWPANDALCSALQIINHIQDCGDDYRTLDRVYIPQDMLAAHGSTTSDLSRPESTDHLRATIGAMLDRLQIMMAEARNLPKFVDDKRLKTETSVIAALGDRLIRLLRRRDPLCDKVKLGKFAVASATVKGIVKAWT
ncbi:MAG: squalene synthase HpnC [Pseudomonadota bacterium]|nr:squalene synthase HpnC [Pseudomonadota bacterium]